MTLVRFDPFRDVAHLRRHIDRLFNDTLSQYDAGSEGDNIAANWVPPVDIFEDEEAVTLRTELPGLGENDIQLSVEDGQLIVRGEKKLEKEESNGAQYRRIESRYGAFYRSFPLPSAIDAEHIGATFKNGVLSITLPKAEEARSRRIDVKVN